MKFPNFDFRQWYQTEVTSIEQVQDLFLNSDKNNEMYYRGMPNYDFVCISTFYRYFINSRELNWSEKNVGFNSMVLLPEIDMDEYKYLSFQILDDFYDNLKNLGSNDIPFETVAYLAQHYGLPTDLLDFSFDPKIALFFACSEFPEHDCSVYMFDIFAVVKKMMQLYGSGQLGWFNNPDGSPMNKQQREQLAKEYCTKLDREGSSTVTPIIRFENIKYSQRIINQKGAFLYHRDSVPMDQIMYTASSETAYNGRKIYKVSKELKPAILKLLDEEYEINKHFIYPNLEADQNLAVIEQAAAITKKKFKL